MRFYFFLSLKKCSFQQIHIKIMSLNFEDCKVYISSVDSQSSAEGGIVVQVIGEMSNRARPWRKFAQTFFLAEQPNGYFVLNDICRYIKEEGDEEEVAAESVSSVVAGEVNAMIPDTSFDYIPQEEYTSGGVPTSTTTETTEELIVVTETTPSSPLSLPSRPLLNEVPQTEIPIPAAIPSPPAASVSEVKEAAPTSVSIVSVEKEVAPEVVVQEAAVVSILEPSPSPSIKAVVPPAPTTAISLVSSPTAKASKQSTKAPKSPKSTSTPTVTPTVAPVPTPASTPANSIAPAAAPTTPPSTTSPVIASKPAIKTWASLAATAPKPKMVAPPVASTSNPTSSTPSTSTTTITPTTSPKYHPSVMSVTNHGCFVKGVIETVSEKALKDALVEKFGALKEFDVIRSRACAFIEFEKLDGARKAIQASMRIGDGGEGGLYIISEVGGTPDLLHVVTRKAVGDRPVSNGRRGGGVVGSNAGDDRSARAGGGQRNGSGSSPGAARGGEGSRVVSGAVGASSQTEEGAKVVKSAPSAKGGKGGAKAPKTKAV